MAEQPRIHQSRVIKQAKGSIAARDGFGALAEIVTAARECIVIHQVEHTKQKKIGAYEQTEIARIKAAETLLRGYFEQVFTERRTNFEELFSRLDKALEEGNGEALHAVVRGIVDIARSSPLADLGDLSQIRAALDDPDQVWDL
jgi:hypothetical protein